jgi:hypothetical protein
MKTSFKKLSVLLVALVWTMLASAQAQYAGIYGGSVDDTAYNDANAGSFAVFVGTNGQATVVGYDVDSFQHYYNGQAGGVAAQFNVPANGNWSFSSNNTIYGVSGSGSIGAGGSFSGTLNFTNGDTLQLNGSLQSFLGNFQNAAGFYSGTFTGTNSIYHVPISGINSAVLSANGQLTFCVFYNGTEFDAGQGQFDSNNHLTTTNTARGTLNSATLTNATLMYGGTFTNSSEGFSGSYTLSRSFTLNIMPILDSPVWQTNRFQMRLTGFANQNYTLQLSTNLTSWTALFITNNATTNTFFLADPNATNKQQFYRILIGP